LNRFGGVAAAPPLHESAMWWVRKQRTVPTDSVGKVLTRPVPPEQEVKCLGNAWMRENSERKKKAAARGRQHNNWLDKETARLEHQEKIALSAMKNATRKNDHDKARELRQEVQKIRARQSKLAEQRMFNVAADDQEANKQQGTRSKQPPPAAATKYLGVAPNAPSMSFTEWRRRQGRVVERPVVQVHMNPVLDESSESSSHGPVEEVVQHHSPLPMGNESELVRNRLTMARKGARPSRLHDPQAVDKAEAMAVAQEFYHLNSRWARLGWRDPEQTEVYELAKEFKISSVEVEKVKRLFDDLDTDNSGEIDEGEFKVLMEKMLGARSSHDISDRRLRDFWRMLDADGEGHATFREFLTFYCRFFQSKTGQPGAARIALLDCVGTVEKWSDKRLQEFIDRDRKTGPMKRRIVGDEA